MWKAIYLVVTLYFTLGVVNVQGLELCQTLLGYEYFIQNVMENASPNKEIGHVDIGGTIAEIEIVQAEHDYFSFNNVTRNVTLKSELDTDEGAPEIPPLILNCRKLGSTVQDSGWLQVIVNVLVYDWNDNPPVFNSQQHSVNISEDSPVGKTVYSDIDATDKDKEFTGNSRLSYRIVPSQEFSAYFAIEVPTLAVITLKKELDYEKITTMTILIEARDKPNPNRGPTRSSTATLTVHILDADDQNPEFSSKTYRGVIREDALPGTVVAVTQRVVARDPDSMNVSVTYKLLDPYEFFDIDPTSAEIRNKVLLNVDVPTLTVVVLASQVDNPNREWFAMLTITISEANINAPSFTKDVYRVTRLELEPVGSVLITTTAKDPDFKTIMGTVLEYVIVDPVEYFSIDESGSIILEKPLNYEQKNLHTLSVTASDGIHTAKTTVEITVLDVNDNNPTLTIPGLEFNAERTKGYVITTVTADDNDINDVLNLELRSNKNLFKVNYLGEVSIIADPEQLTLDRYSLLVSVIDDGTPPRESSKQIDVIFPPLVQPPTSSPPVTKPVTPTGSTETATAIAPAGDNMMTIVLGAVAGVLLVVIIILIVYIVWRNKRTKEELDRARAPRGHAAKGLTYRQAEVPDDLPKMDLNFTDDYDGISEAGATTVQQNPLRKQGVNQAYLQSSGSEMDRDVSEIEVETAVVPYDDDFGYPSGHGHFRTFHGDDTTSNESNQSDSTGNSQRVLVNENKNEGNKMTSWDSDDKIHPQGAEKLLDAKSSTGSRTKKERPEITVYF